MVIIGAAAREPYRLHASTQSRKVGFQMKKMLSFLLCVTLLISVMPAALAQEGDNYVHIIGRNLGYAIDENNIILQELEKRTGLDIDWELWPTDGYAQQCQLTFGSGEYPDAMEVWWSSWPNQFIELIEDGVVQPVDDLIAANAPNVQVTRSDSDYYDYGDGQKWAIPCRVLEDGNTYCVVIRQDWLDKLGLPVPTSSEEYFNTLQAFQEHAEELTGNPDAIAAHGACTTYFGNCLTEYVFSENGFQKAWNDVDGTMVYYINMPGYKNAMRTLRKFFQAGLIEPEYLLMNRDQFLDKLYTNVYGAFDYSTDILDPAITSWTKGLYDAVPEARLTVIPPFADENGETHLRTVGQSIQCVVFENAEHPENVMKLLNYLATEEGMLLTQFGIEGEHWQYDENGNPQSLLTTDEERAAVGTGSYAWMYRLSYFNAAFSSEFDDERALISAATVPTAVMPTTASYMDSKATLTSLVSTYTAELICNPDIDFDETFDKYIKEWNELGGELWTQEINEYWQSRQ